MATLDTTALQQQIAEMGSRAHQHGYAGPAQAAIDQFLHCVELAATAGIEPRPIFQSQPRRNGQPVMEGPEATGWLTDRGLENEETSLIDRANHAGLDIAAILRQEKQDACPCCREARETGHHKNLRIVSHEETQCRHCGAYYFVPDY